MADIIKELMESLNEFEIEMNKDLSHLKYDNALYNYRHLRFKFQKILDNNIDLDSKAYNVILDKRQIVKYYKDDAILEKIKNGEYKQ